MSADLALAYLAFLSDMEDDCVEAMAELHDQLLGHVIEEQEFTHDHDECYLTYEWAYTWRTLLQDKFNITWLQLVTYRDNKRFERSAS